MMLNYLKISFKLFHVEHFDVDAAVIGVRSKFWRESFFEEFSIDELDDLI